MAYSAIGLGATKNGDGTITVKAQIINDSDGGRVVEVLKPITGANIAAIRAALQAAVDAKVDAESDQALNAAVVGRVLVTSK